jgi:hypothetical protein
MLLTILDYSRQLILEDQTDFGGNIGILYTTSSQQISYNNFQTKYFSK